MKRPVRRRRVPLVSITRLSSESGAGAILAVFVLATLFLMIATGMALVQITRSGLTQQLRYHGQAINAAQAGLVDALAWFRRQTTQPVSTFAPARNTSVTPPVNETDDATIGIVRDYVVDSQAQVWGRYEVRKTAVRDVTAERGKQGTGTVWQLESRGFIYTRKDATKRYDEAPNQIIARSVARTEIQRLSLVLPANAGICCYRGDRVYTDTKTRLYGGDHIGVAYPPSTGYPNVRGEFTGSPRRTQASPYNDSISSVFGVTKNELVAMADIVVTSVSELPPKLPDMALVVINGNATFTSTQRMTGTGVLVVFGNLTVQSNSYSNYNGLIYVTGNYYQYAPSQVNGAVVSQGYTQLRATGDFAELFYDEGILTQIQRHMGQYRFARNQQFTQD